MKFLSLAILFVSFETSAFPVFRNIYGSDDRREVYEAGKHAKLADSHPALIVNSFLVKKRGKYVIDAPTLEASDGTCSSERYQSQPAASLCSGTLIAPDLILTAAHCYNNDSICKQASWAFGYHEKRNGKYEIKEKELYRCKEVVFRSFDIQQGHDFAVVKLDRKVKGHKPVSLRPEGSPEVRTRLILVGNPRGLPTKIADNAWITEIKENVLITNVDAYTGNSGSGVYNADTGFLEGVLSYGKEDYKEDEERSCFTSQVYSMEEGGEAVMKIDPVREFLKTYQSARP